MLEPFPRLLKQLTRRELKLLWRMRHGRKCPIQNAPQPLRHMREFALVSFAKAGGDSAIITGTGKQLMTWYETQGLPSLEPQPRKVPHEPAI